MWLLDIRFVLKHAEFVVVESIAAKEFEIDEFGSEGIDSREGTYGGGGGRVGGGKELVLKLFDGLENLESLLALEICF